MHLFGLWETITNLKLFVWLTSLLFFLDLVKWLADLSFTQALIGIGKNVSDSSKSLKGL
jgi:hypothetical protein